MKKNDLDFLAAYRVSNFIINFKCLLSILYFLQGHMLKVQAELDRLKRKTNECEFIIKKDERVKKLQAQIAWFREEALHLSTQLQKHKTAGAQLREKVYALETDNENLKKLNVRSVGRERQLKKALEKSQENCQELLQLISAQEVNLPPRLESSLREQQMESEDE